MKHIVASVLLLGCSVIALAQGGFIWGAGTWGGAAWGAGFGAPSTIPSLPPAGLAALIILVAITPLLPKISQLLKRKR